MCCFNLFCFHLIECPVESEAFAASFVFGPSGAPDDRGQQVLVSMVASLLPCVSFHWLWLRTRLSVFRLKESVILAGDPSSAFTSTSQGSALVPHRLSDSGLCSPPSNLCARTDDAAFGLCGFDNKSYSIVLPGFPQQGERSELRTRGELISDPAYSGDSDGQELLEHLLLTSALLPLVDTDMCYQVTKADSVQVPHTGDSRRSSISRGSRTLCDLSSGLGLKLHDAGGDAAKINNSGERVRCGEENLFYRAGSSSPLPVDFSYQSFQSLAEPCDALTSEKSRWEKRLSGHPGEPHTPEHISHPATSCCTDADGSPASPASKSPFLSLLSANQSAPTITVDSGYHSV